MWRLINVAQQDGEKWKAKAPDLFSGPNYKIYTVTHNWNTTNGLANRFSKKSLGLNVIKAADVEAGATRGRSEFIRPTAISPEIYPSAELIQEAI